MSLKVKKINRVYFGKDQHMTVKDRWLSSQRRVWALGAHGEEKEFSLPVAWAGVSEL